MLHVPGIQPLGSPSRLSRQQTKRQRQEEGDGVSVGPDPDDAASVSVTIADLGKQFDVVLAELTGEGSVVQFRSEYEKLHGALVESLQNEAKLQSKAKELQEQIVMNSGKVQTALQLSVDDQNTIYQLKEEVRKAWEIVEELHEKEKKSKETIGKLTRELTELSGLVDRGMGLEKQRKKERTVRLLQEKEKMMSNLDEKKKAVDEWQRKLAKAAEAISKCRCRVRDAAKERRVVMQKSTEVLSLAKREKDNLSKAFRTLAGKTNLIDKKRAAIHDIDREFTRENTLLETRKTELEEEKRKVAHSKNRYIAIHIDIEGLHQKIEGRATANVEMDMENKKRENVLNEKKKELLMMQNRLARSNDTRDNERSRVERLEFRVKDLAADAERAEMLIGELERDIDVVRDRISGLRVEKKKREYLKNVVSRNMVNTSESRSSILEETVAVDSDAEMLRLKFLSQNELFESQKKEIVDLKKDRERQSEKTNKVKIGLREQVQKVKMSRLDNSDLSKQLIELTERLKQASSRYEAVRRERNQYSKMYVDCQEQVFEMKKKYGVLNKQIGHLREGIQICERLKDEVRKKLSKGERGIDKVKEEKDRHADELKTLTEQLRDIEVKRAKLRQSVMQTDCERKRQLKRLKEMANQRDRLGMQLIRRNDELALLHEKLKVQERYLDNGKREYLRRVDDCRLLRLAIKELSRSLCVRSRQMEGIEEREKIVEYLTETLTKVRKEVRATSEIMQDPKNKMRWRTLRGARKDQSASALASSDPSSFELSRKIQSLQTRLIHKTERLVDTEVQIGRQKRLFKQLQAIMKRQPNPKLSHRLNVLQHKLRNTTTTMKAAAAELNYVSFERKEKRFEVERLARLIAEIEKQYYRVRKNQQQRRRMVGRVGRNRRRSSSSSTTSTTSSRMGGFGDEQLGNTGSSLATAEIFGEDELGGEDEGRL